MPVQRRPRTGTTTRRFGIEMEGYVSTYPRDITISGATIKRDASLHNSRWLRSRGTNRYGVEVVTNPIKTLAVVERIVSKLGENGWSGDEKAGTHVHIEIADYDQYDRIKLLRFCKGIERIMLMFAKDYRNGNRYCNTLPKQWSKVFKTKHTAKLDALKGVQPHFITFPVLRDMGLHDAVNSKYYWCNLYGTPTRPTVEFRLFHNVTSATEAVKFIKLTNAIVDIVKNSTIEQLEFLIMSLYESKTPLSIAKNLYYALGMNYDVEGLSLIGNLAVDYMRDKLIKKHTKKVANAESSSYSYMAV